MHTLSLCQTSEGKAILFYIRCYKSELRAPLRDITRKQWNKCTLTGASVLNKEGEKREILLKSWSVLSGTHLTSL